MTSTIHPTATIDRTAEIAPGVEIGPFCVIGPYVELGTGTRLHNHVTITGPTTIGRDNEFYPFTVIGAAPQDLKFFGEHALCIIGDRNQIREHATIHRGTRNGGGVTRVGNDNLLMVASHVAHDCVVGSHCVIANQVMLGGHTVIEDCVNIGGGTGVHHFTTIGTLAFVGGLTRVKKDVPPYMKVEGDPVEVRGVNTIGLARRSYRDVDIAALKDAYKRLFMRVNGHGHYSDATGNNGHHHLPGPRPMSVVIEEVRAELGHLRPVAKLCDFLERSAHGVHGRSRENAREDSKYATQPK